ncbi:glycosylase [Mucilaginibacter robiniae]|uniref:Glycosylase n=1 Tax=Mucilaginibacter robiniae TaxID=2728022 RepID=A0A7L5E4Q0_9SPHI|nr:glycosylase [Mucilaginibacter robiniae]QJD97279.1 glycosylase [Mucilaginibacter robiniae]
MHQSKFIKFGLLWIASLLFAAESSAQSEKNKVPEKVMQEVYEQVKTPYKYGLVIAPTDNSQKADCPTVFRKGNKWYMTYIIFNGRGYETWMADSKDLLHWKTQGRILSFSDTTDWDNNQKAGYVALEDTKWGGTYQLQKYNGKYWMSYFGGHDRGYEKGLLSIGIAYTTQDPSTIHQWQRLNHPVLTATDSNVHWWDNHTLYKETIIWDKAKTTGHPFVMYYNANGDSLNKKRGAERIGMAVSDDMLHWERFGLNPVLNHNVGITGDPYLQRMGNVWVMFYFGAFWKDRGGAFNRFACSYDLINWTDWQGESLIKPTETAGAYDEVFAHKSFVIKYKGVIYHYYCAVNKADQRGIAVATSKDLGRSTVNFVEPPPSKRKK